MTPYLQQFLYSQQLTVRLALFLILLFSMLTVSLIIFTFLSRIYNELVRIRNDRFSKIYENLFFLYLNNPNDPHLISNMRKIRHKEKFYQFLIPYLKTLKGLEHDRTMQLIYELKIPPEMQKHLNHRRRWKRAYAAFVLGELKYAPALPYLEKAARDKFYFVQFQAARAIIRIGNTRYLYRAILFLFYTPHLSPYQMMLGLMELPESGLEICLEILKEVNALTDVQKKLIVDLFTYRRYNTAAPEILELLKQTRHWELKISCIRALGLLNYMPAVFVLRNMLQEKDWVLRSQVLLTLGRIGDLGSLPEFLEDLKSNIFWVKYNAGLALYYLGEIGIEHLQKIKNDPQHPGHEIAEQILIQHRAMAG